MNTSNHQTPYQKMLAEGKKRQERALALKRAGKTMDEIGEELGVSKQRASAMAAKAEQEESGRT